MVTQQSCGNRNVIYVRSLQLYHNYLGNRVGLGTVLQEQCYDIPVADSGSDVQWRSLFSCLRVGVTAVTQQHSNYVGLIRASRQMKRSLPTHGLDVRGAE